MSRESTARAVPGTAIAAILVGLVAIAVWTTVELRRQREELVAVAADERSGLLDHAVSQVAADFDDVAGDLEFTMHLVDESADDDATRSSLRALLAVARPYRLAGVYGPDCSRRMLVSDPRWSSDSLDSLVGALDTSGSATCARGDELVDVSTPVGTGDLGWYRVYSRALPHGGAMALLVDTRSMLAYLATVTGDPAAELLVMGPHGMPTPASTPRLAQAAASERGPAFDDLMRRMTAGERGWGLIPADEAVRMGYADADLVMVWSPIEGQLDAPRWTAATVYSTAALQDHEQRARIRLGASSLAAVLLVLGAGTYIVRTQRAQAEANERLRTADEVAHLRERAERILDHVPAGVVALGGGAITSVNETARRWGAVADARTLRDLLPRASDDAIGRLGGFVSAAIASGRVAGSAAERLSLFGQDGAFSVHAVPIVPATPSVDVLLVIADLTDVSRLQEQILRMEKLSTVGVLAAGIAHEVGTPLGVIRGRAELVARKVGADHPQTASLRVIIEQIDRISRTIRALLEFSSPRAIVAGPVAIDVPIARVSDLVRYEVEKHQVAFEVVIAPDLPTVRADSDQIQQILVNLVMNSLDATAPNGRITLSASPSETDPHQLSLKVTDTGAGIPPEDLHRVFDPFFTTKKRGHGTGLGLPIVAQIARDHGGVVRIDSTPGRGTTIEILLPLTEKPRGS